MKGVLLFDIDGVIRDVSGSYRLAIQETVAHFSKCRPTLENIDNLKSEGCWNNDWQASQELIKRHQEGIGGLSDCTPSLKEIEKVFSGFYFGGNPDGDSKNWKGFIKNEPLLVDQKFFRQLVLHGYQYGFVSGAETPSAKFVLEKRLNLKDPPLIAMGDAPDKPDPKGFLLLASELIEGALGLEAPVIAYLGDTIADVLTIQRARKEVSDQNFVSLAVAPPHLHGKENQVARLQYENDLRGKGADIILQNTTELLSHLMDLRSVHI